MSATWRQGVGKSCISAGNRSVPDHATSALHGAPSTGKKEGDETDKGGNWLTLKKEGANLIFQQGVV